MHHYNKQKEAGMFSRKKYLKSFLIPDEWNLIPQNVP